VIWLACGGAACRTPARPSPDAAAPDAAAPDAAAAAADSAVPGAGEAAASASEKSAVHGYIATRYRGRTSGGDDDHDLDTVVGLDFGDANKDRISGHVMARAGADLDGSSASDPFFSLDDTFDGRVTARLYYAWADIRPERSFLERWRIGRQLDYLTPEFAWFDGVSVQTRERGKAQMQMGLYGGIPVHLFESSSSGDALAGAFAQGRPWKNGRVRADWMHLVDETRLAEHDNDLLSLGLWQQVRPELRMEAKYTHLEDEPRDARVQAQWFDAHRELTLFVSHYELLRTQKSLALEVDPFFNTLLEQFPYRQTRLLASKTLNESLQLQGGLDVRRVSDDSDVGQFNRDFERTFLTATASDLLPKSVTLSVTGEVWNSPDSDIQTWGADLSRKFAPSLDASVGSYYALFKYDLFSIEERNDVRTYYLFLRWKRTAASAFDLRYEFEDSDFGDFHTLRLGSTWRF
jgi:hypothetical protein